MGTIAQRGFHEEQALMTYKAFQCGAPIVLVDPRNTSRICSCCHLIDKRNRCVSAWKKASVADSVLVER